MPGPRGPHAPRSTFQAPLSPLHRHSFPVSSGPRFRSVAHAVGSDGSDGSDVQQHASSRQLRHKAPAKSIASAGPAGRESHVKPYARIIDC